MEKIILVWLVDAVVESLLAVSMGSLRLNAPDFWSQNLKVVIDCGLSDPFRMWLQYYSPEGIRIVPAPPLDIERSLIRGVDVLRRRVNISSLITSIDVVKVGDPVLVCDADTVFLKAPDEFPFPGGEYDLTIMPGWIVRDDGGEAPTPWMRAATLMVPYPDNTELVHIAEQLGLSAVELQRIRSYNTGVFGFRAGRKFDDPWRKAFREILQTTYSHKGAWCFPHSWSSKTQCLCAFTVEIFA